MKLKRANYLARYKRFLPTKDVTYHFLSNLLLLLITLSIGNYYITNKLQETDRNKAVQQQQIEQQTSFVKTFTELGHDVIYHAERYYGNYTADEDPDVLVKIWDEYMVAVEAWNRKNLLHSVFIRSYYGEATLAEFNNNLLPKLAKMHETLRIVRNGGHVDDMAQVIEDAKHEMYIFSEKMIFDKTLKDGRP